MPKKRKPRRQTPVTTGIPFPWEDSKQNDKKATDELGKLLPSVVSSSRAGHTPTLEDVRTWHRVLLSDITVAHPQVKGGLRGEGLPGSELRNYRNQVGAVAGVGPAEVPGRVDAFFSELQQRTAKIADTMPIKSDEQFRAAMALCAWTHGEWIRIHPFANYNGTTVRLLAVAVAARLGIPLPIPIKPRPTGSQPAPAVLLSYDTCAAAQMNGVDGLMAAYLEASARYNSS